MSQNPQAPHPAGSEWAPASTTTRPQAPGQAGIDESLMEVAKRATLGSIDHKVRSWATHHLDACGRPDNHKDRARCLFQAMQKQLHWVPDPVGVELMPAPHLLLGPPGGKPYFAAGDCDDLTIAFLSAYLAGNLDVGIQAGVLGHSYRRDKQITHVLAAIYDDESDRWLCADPSSDYPFGECKKPTFEKLIVLPSQQVECEGACVAGSGAKHIPPSQIEGGIFVGIQGLPASNMTTIEVQQLGDLLSAELLEMAQAILRHAATVSDALVSITNITESMGLPVYEETSWTKQEETTAENAIKSAAFASRALQEVASGERTISVASRTGDIFIESLPNDAFVLVPTENSMGITMVPATSANAPLVSMATPGPAKTQTGVGSPPIVSKKPVKIAVDSAGLFAVANALDIAHNRIIRRLQQLAGYVYSTCVSAPMSPACQKAPETITSIVSRTAYRRPDTEAAEEASKHAKTVRTLEFWSVVGGLALVGYGIYEALTGKSGDKK